MSVLIRLRNLSETFFNLTAARYKKMCVGLQVKYPPIILLQMLTKLEIYRQIFEKYSNIKKLLKSVQWEQICTIRKDGRTDMTKLILAFRNFAGAPKMFKLLYCTKGHTVDLTI
jgi:hypothetical protein